MTTNNAVAKRISLLLKKQKITLYRLEQKSGVYHGAMDRILKGKNSTVSLNTLYKLARGFDMNILEFLNDELFLSEEIEVDWSYGRKKRIDELRIKNKRRFC